jgi:acyl carrier protein
MVFEKVQQLLSEQLNVPAEKITLESNIVADLHADSLDVVEMLMSLEDNFNIQVDDEDAANLLTVGAIVEYIENATK